MKWVHASRQRLCFVNTPKAGGASTPEEPPEDPVVSRVRIHYRRPPDRITVFEQACVYDGGDVIVTLAARSGIPRPMQIGGQVALEPDSAVVWFTFPDLHHDIGRFHRVDGTFTGLYANILTPIEFTTRYNWSTTDLYLDLWLGAGKSDLLLLDEAELDDAIEQGCIDRALAGVARSEAQRIEHEWQAGRWPPRIVAEWTLERARAVRSLVS